MKCRWFGNSQWSFGITGSQFVLWNESTIRVDILTLFCLISEIQFTSPSIIPQISGLGCLTYKAKSWSWSTSTIGPTTHLLADISISMLPLKLVWSRTKQHFVGGKVMLSPVMMMSSRYMSNIVIPRDAWRRKRVYTYFAYKMLEQNFSNQARGACLRP